MRNLGVVLEKSELTFGSLGPLEDTGEPPAREDHLLRAPPDGAEEAKRPLDWHELLVLQLDRRRQEQGVRPRDLLNRLVLSPQMLAEGELVALALEPGLFAPLRPRIEPLLEEAVVVDHEAVLVPHVVEQERDLEHRWLHRVLSPREGVPRDSALRVPAPVGGQDHVLHEGERRQHVTLAARVRAVERGHREQAFRVSVHLARARVFGIAQGRRLHGEDLLVPKGPVVLDPKLDEHGCRKATSWGSFVRVCAGNVRESSPKPARARVSEASGRLGGATAYSGTGQVEQDLRCLARGAGGDRPRAPWGDPDARPYRMEGPSRAAGSGGTSRCWSRGACGARRESGDGRGVAVTLGVVERPKRNRQSLCSAAPRSRLLRVLN